MANTETVKSDVVNDYGIELGIFVACSTAISALIYYKIKGDFSRLEGYFALKKWNIMKSPNI